MKCEKKVNAVAYNAVCSACLLNAVYSACLMLFIVLAYLMLLAALSNAVCLYDASFLPMISAIPFYFHVFSCFFLTYCYCLLLGQLLQLFLHLKKCHN